MSRRPSLGRGLAALIPDDVLDSAPQKAPGNKVLELPLGEITPNPEQPRSHFDEQRLKELAASISEHGVLQPLLVRSQPGGGYILIAGERRLRAAGLAGLESVPALLREGADHGDVQLELALVENLQRQDLDPVESARGYHRLQQDYGYTQEQIALKVGKERATVANALRLLRLPDKILNLVREGRLSAGHAKALLPVADDNEVLRSIVAQVLAKDLSVRATEALVRGRRKVKRDAVKSKRHDKALRYVSDILSRSLSTQVDIKPKGRGEGGRILIDYSSAEELERLIEVLRSGE
ncbi:MAG: ParB/RepB/Spo0J family partition protein [Myxococcota bacterium]|nr:ParB/RepB/Spo0J family partition protein [Myxococcota bacterium]